VPETGGPAPLSSGEWKLPLFEAHTGQQVLEKLQACVRAHPESFVKLNGYDPGRQGLAASFVIHHPAAVTGGGRFRAMG
jgi:ribulose bisphosphate carboxylase small subunit